MSKSRIGWMVGQGRNRMERNGYAQMDRATFVGKL